MQTMNISPDRIRYIGVRWSCVVYLWCFSNFAWKDAVLHPFIEKHPPPIGSSPVVSFLSCVSRSLHTNLFHLPSTHSFQFYSTKACILWLAFVFCVNWKFLWLNPSKLLSGSLLFERSVPVTKGTSVSCMSSRSKCSYLLSVSLFAFKLLVFQSETIHW